MVSARCVNWLVEMESKFARTDPHDECLHDTDFLVRPSRVLPPAYARPGSAQAKKPHEEAANQDEAPKNAGEHEGAEELKGKRP